MKIELKEISVKEPTEGYQDNNEAGVVGFGGKLDIRPPYQREFIYKDKQRDAVINTVRKANILSQTKWKPTTQLRGTKTAKPKQQTVRCSARKITEENRGCNSHHSF